MFFGGLPLMILYLPLAFLPRLVASGIIIYGVTFTAIGVHLFKCSGDTLYRDSKYTLFAAAWLPFSFFAFQMFCAIDHKCS